MGGACVSRARLNRIRWRISGGFEKNDDTVRIKRPQTALVHIMKMTAANESESTDKVLLTFLVLDVGIVKAGDSDSVAADKTL